MKKKKECALKPTIPRTANKLCVCVWCVCGMYVKALQLCLTLCDPMDYSPPGSSVHGILQA